MAFEPFLKECQTRVGEVLVKILSELKGNLEPSLAKAMHYSVLNGGKRIRPAIVYAVGQTLGVPWEQLDGPAAAIEFIHCYSLVHDDLPAMDNDDFRRGKPTCHKVYSESTAILVGDALQTLAFQILSDPKITPLPPSVQIQMVAVLAQASGANNGMVSGQALDIASENKTVDLNTLTTLHRQKTGALFNACVLLGYLASDRKDSQLKEKLIQFADAIGVAFQVQDDILDQTSDTNTLGKTARSDMHHGKSTFVTLMGLPNAQAYASDLGEQAQQILGAIDQWGMLKQLTDFLVARTC